MFTGINESNTLTKHILCECKYRFDGNKYNSDQWCNNNKYQCKCKKRHICVKGYIWNRSTCNCKHGKYLAIIIDDAVFTCDEVIGSCDEETKTIVTHFNDKKATFKTKYLYFTCIFINYYNVIDSC